MSNSTTNLDLVSASQANKEVTVNSALDAASPAMLYGRRAVTTAGLTWGYYGGTALVAGTPAAIANGTLALVASTTNYVQADPATGAVSANSTGFTAGHKQLYSIVTGANAVTSYADLRTLGGDAGGVSSVNGQDGNVVLDASDVGADPAGSAASAVSTHQAASDPHPQYLTLSEGNATYDAAGAASAAVAAHVAASDPHPQYLTQTEGDARYTTAGSGGSVTSVGLTTPGLLFDVTGSPVTSAGTLAVSLKTQVKNTVLAGPATGADAVPTMRALTAADLPAQPFDLTAFYSGVPGASAIVTRVPVARAVTFPSALSGSIGKASVAATAQTDFDVQKNGASVGTIRFAAAATSATFIAASAITLAAGDILAIISPATADATLANVGIVLAGTR